MGISRVFLKILGASILMGRCFWDGSEHLGKARCPMGNISSGKIFEGRD
jgi:hypothetical protein